MVIDRVPDKSYKNKQNIKMVIDTNTFDILCKYIISNSAYLRMNHISNLNKLISGLDIKPYENDPERIKRIKFIKRGIEARMVYNLNDRMLILNHIKSGLDFDIDFIDFNNCELTANEIQWCHQMVSESIQYSFVYNYTDDLLDICTRIKTSDYSHRGNLINQFEGMIDNLKNEFRKSKTENNMVDKTFSLRNGIFEEVVTDTYNLITNPSRRLICGMQGLNEMIGGGFESGRVYMFMGITGIGKSVSLLNIVYQLKKFNKNYKTKDPTKTPCIVLLTMENTVVETITRLFDMTVESASGLGMANFSVNDVIYKLRTEGQLTLNDESPIDIVIKYKPNKSVDTSYLYTLCDDLEDEGYEVICLVQDHVKRIRSIYNSSDIRIELGDIVNEFKVFAADKDIPVLTDTHLNRDAARIIEEGSQKVSKTDTTMKLGKSNVGESLLMMDNIDCAIIINLDFDDENNKYMVFSLIKMRDKTDRTYIAQPFAYGSSIRMLEDVGGIPMFKEHLHMNNDVPRIASIRTTSANVMSNIKTIVNSNKPTDTTFGGTSYNFNNFEDEDIQINSVEPLLEDINVGQINAVNPIFFFNNNSQPLNMKNLGELKQQLAMMH